MSKAELDAAWDRLMAAEDAVLEAVGLWDMRALGERRQDLIRCMLDIDVEEARYAQEQAQEQHGCGRQGAAEAGRQG